MTGIFEPWAHGLQLVQAISAPGLAIVLEVLVKGTILMLFAAFLSLVLRRASAATRHLIWTLALGSILALPLFALALPAWNVPLFASFSSGAAIAQTRLAGDSPASRLDSQLAQSSENQSSDAKPWAKWVLLLWATGSALFLARMAVGEVRVRRLVRRSQPFRAGLANVVLEDGRRGLRVARAVALRVSPETGTPFTRGILHPEIVVPEQALQWQRDELEFVLAHELAHVSRHDCLTQMPAQLACALFWFHPLVWLAAVQMRKERERACDDMVLNLGHPAADYAAFLVMLCRGLRQIVPAWSTGIAMAESSQLEVRMKALLNPKINHKPLAAKRALFAAVLTVALLVPAAAIHAAANNDTGSISGTVHDPSGAVIPGAAVTLISSKTQTRIPSRTGQDGNFGFPGVPPGRYRLEFAKPGFARTLTGEFDLGPSRDLHQNFTLNLGWVSQEVVVRGHRPAEAAPAHPRPPHRIRVGGLVQAAKLVQFVKPAYPESAEKQGTEGTVILRSVIGTGGQILSLEPYNGADPALTKAAMNAVRQWSYQPTLLNGAPVEVATTVTVVFRLDQ
ncbi:MAG TPA: M56 family metallopeptidase [Terriglobia bacterium]|nr:M56 family metallopeptidase [Terriglobia bacterium]